MINYCIIHKCEDKSVVLVDFFDTVMFRHIHSHQMMGNWAKALVRKYPELDEKKLVEYRNRGISNGGGDECAIEYHDLLVSIYKMLETKRKVDLEEFERVSYQIDYSLDMATQYPNKEILDTLRHLRHLGKKIYLVTDYYLSGKCYTSYLRPYGLENFFDGIFCSSDYKKTKRNGDLYDEVIKKLAIESSCMCMIGDSKYSDVINAEKRGILGYHYFPMLHKIRTNIRKRIAYPYEKTIFADIFKTTFNEDGETFGDYALNLFYFTRELDRNVKEKGISRIGFLARGGYFLKECLDRYEQILMPTEMNTYYVKNSRKVNRMAEKSRDDEILLKKYLKQFSDGNYLCLVDEGWYCSSQILMQKKLGFDIDGYYLGIMGRKNEDADCRRKGILFDTDGNGQSPLFGVFRTNCTFYEQILSAPHGSTVAYKEVNGKIQAVEKWHEKEKENYEERINKIQNVILDYLTGITSWVGQGTTLTKYTLACFVLRQLMFGSSKRILTENEILGSWYDNANDTADKKFASIKNVHVKMDVFYRPENYLRYFCKLKTLTLKHPAMKIIYPVLGRAIYLYCRISIFFKYRNVR